MLKKGEMGIGTLIIFIALLLVAAIAAGVLIQTGGSLQEKALTTGDQAESQIATNIRVIEVSATDGTDGELNYFNQIIKLAPGSEPIKISQVVFTMNTYDNTATLKYAGSNATFENEANGYYTYNDEIISGDGGVYDTLSNDYDADNVADSLTGGDNGSNLILNLSGVSDITLGNCSSGTFTSVMTTNDYVKSISSYTCDADDNVTSITISPKNVSTGNFAVEYLQKGNNWVAGNLQRGDVVKVYYEAPKNIGEDEQIRLNFIPKIGTPTLTEFITPEVISDERVYLYP